MWKGRIEGATKYIKNLTIEVLNQGTLKICNSDIMAENRFTQKIKLLGYGQIIYIKHIQ